MHRRFLAAVVAASVACGVMPAAASAKLKLGVTDFALQNRDPVLFWKNVTDLKMTVIRTQVSWRDIAPHKPSGNMTDPNNPAYNWKLIDRNVKDAEAWAKANNGTVIYNVWSTPSWARKYKTGKVVYVPVPNATYFKRFMQAVATRYNGTFIPKDATEPLPKITHWEIWNEPNNALGLAKPKKGTNGVPAGAGEYLSMLRTAYTQIHAQDKPGQTKSQVIAGAVGGRTGINHVAFYSALKKGHAKMDAISVHPYSLVPKWGPTDGAPGRGYLQPFYRLGNFNRFIGLVRGWRGAKFPIWVTEIGWQVNPPEKRLGVTSRQQSNFFKSTVAKLRKYPQVQGMTWYMLRDERSLAGWQSGLLTKKNTKRVIWTTWKNIKK